MCPERRGFESMHGTLHDGMYDARLDGLDRALCDTGIGMDAEPRSRDVQSHSA
jgi:hypothetical protein